MKRYCQTLTIPDDQEAIKKYIEAHANVWSEVIDGQREVGILSMQIYALNNQLFMIVDTIDEFDWDRDMNRLAQMPTQIKWEAHVSQFQKCDPNAKSTDKWHMLKKIFDTDNL